MQQDLPVEQRLAILERKVADLEHERTMQDDRDIALLARADGAYEAIKRVERVQLRMFDEVTTGIKNIEARLNDVPALFQDHKEAIEKVAGRVAALEDSQADVRAGIQQVISLLSGNQPRND